MSDKIKTSLEAMGTQPMEAALERLLNDDNLYVFGHGTADESFAQAIIQDGLHLSSANLWSTVAGLPEKTDETDHLDTAKKMIEDWPHLALGYVVAVGVERLPVEKIPHRRYLQSIVQDRPHADAIDERYGQRYTIEPRFVAGYFNARAKTFVPNPNFDPTYDPALMETTADDDINRERDAVPVLEWMGAAAVSESTGIPSADQFINLDGVSDDTPLVW